MTLVEFLLARIAEDEALIRMAPRALDRVLTTNRIAVWQRMDGGWEVVLDFERVLAECDAKRRIVELHQIEVSEVSLPPFDALTGEPNPPEFDVTCNVCGWASPVPSSACETLRLLALPYADHPDYRQEWRP